MNELVDVHGFIEDEQVEGVIDVSKLAAVIRNEVHFQGGFSCTLTADSAKEVVKEWMKYKNRTTPKIFESGRTLQDLGDQPYGKPS